MEAASGGYVDVGRIRYQPTLPVPSSRDTVLSIASDKGNKMFVELVLTWSAQVDTKSKKETRQSGSVATPAISTFSRN